VSKRIVDVEVEVTFLPPEHGGKNIPISAGYRPQFYYGGHDWDAEHFYPGRSLVHPGETVEAQLTFLSPKAHVGKIWPGKAFLIREGNRIVGFGSITRIVDLEASARHSLVADNL
jgi:translation elongation factor EF-Tu-like GTPase